MCKRFQVSLTTLFWLMLLATCFTPIARGHQPAPPTSNGPVPLMHDSTTWVVQTSEGVKATLTRDMGRDGRTPTAWRLDYDFTLGAGFVIIRREWAAELPADYRFDLWLRGEAPSNNLEFKLVDPSGHNVWWNNARAFEMPREWTKRSYRARQIAFAWGPIGGGAPTTLGSLEFAIASAEGGRGSVWFDGLEFREVPPVSPPSGAIVGRASSNTGGATSFEVPESGEVQWRQAADDATPRLDFDLRGMREFGGVILDWAKGAGPKSCVVSGSVDGQRYEELARVDGGGRDGRVYILTPDAQASWLRIEPTPSDPSGTSSGGNTLELRRLELAPLTFGESMNAAWSRIARDAPRGWYPRCFLGEQNYWTVIGVPDDFDEALMDEDGAIETGRLAWRLEPFLIDQGDLLTWADAKATHTLEGGWMPMPHVELVFPALSLGVTCMATSENERPTWLARYRVKNLSEATREVTLALACRPIQVLPPSQSLNITGGASRVVSVAKHGDGVVACDVQCATAPAPIGYLFSTFQRGEVIEKLQRLASGRVTGDTIACAEDSAAKAASGAMLFAIRLLPGEDRDVIVAWWSSARTEHNFPVSPAAFDAVMASQRAAWIESAAAFGLRLPAHARSIEDAARSTLAYIEVNGDGPSIQPGSRSYERSWIRDGSLTSAALLAFGHTEKALRFVDWYAQHIFDSGRVPCVVDRRGPDPVPEHDSHGQYIFAVMNAYRFTHDLAILEHHWDRVVKVVAAIEALRDQRRTPEFQDPSRTRQEPGKASVPAAAFYGLMPESISHEGYSAKPMHSYWDDLFTLRGLCDAAEMARVLDHGAEAERFAALRDSFRHDLSNSIDLTTKAHGIDFMPGCVELGDFDSTSTTVALWPGEFEHRLIAPTFERYWTWFQDRAKANSWDAYTPYELRHVGALVRLGQRERAWEALAWYMQHQRPRGWNQWAEVVGREERKARFLGDMPHTWCGSDFLNSVRTMLVYERVSDESLVVGAGVPWHWLAEGGLEVRLPTWYGTIGYSLKLQKATDGSESIVWEGHGDATPPGGLELRPPGLDRVTRANVDDQDVEAPIGSSLRVPSGTKRVEWHLRP